MLRDRKKLYAQNRMANHQNQAAVGFEVDPDKME
jgi:hypothetical protein